MTTAVIISELIPIHDDALVADIDAAFEQIDREIIAANDEASRETRALLLDVEWLVDELCEETMRLAREPLEISLELQFDCNSDEVAEVA